MLNLKPKYVVDYIENAGHYYIIDGMKYGSVTSVLKIIGGDKTDALMGWSKKVALNYVSEELKQQLGKDIKINEEFIDQIMKAGSKRPEYEKTKAGDFGTAAHELIDTWIKTKSVPKDDNICKPVFDGFMKFIKEHNYNIVSPDLILGSRQYGFGGRGDGVIMDKDGNYIILDFKTGFVSADAHLQVSAYAHCFSEQYGVPVPKQCIIIKFYKDQPVYEIHEVNNVDECFKAFLAAKVLKETIEGISKK